MFKYNKKIDEWSHDMIKDLIEVWGNKIPNSDSKLPSTTSKYLIKYLDEYMARYGKVIINRFNKITGLSFKLNDFNFYINNTPVSLHNSKDMFISVSKNHSFNSYPTIIIHEIFHIYFYKYLNKKNNTISETDKNDIKEIITVILNEEFKDIIETLDEGYPVHKKIRDKILKIWREVKTFDKFILKTIQIYKKG